MGKNVAATKIDPQDKYRASSSIPVYMLLLKFAINKTKQNIDSFTILKHHHFYQNAISIIRNQLELNAKLYAPFIADYCGF